MIPYTGKINLHWENIRSVNETQNWIEYSAFESIVARIVPTFYGNDDQETLFEYSIIPLILESYRISQFLLDSQLGSLRGLIRKNPLDCPINPGENITRFYSIYDIQRLFL